MRLLNAHFCSDFLSSPKKFQFVSRICQIVTSTISGICHHEVNFACRVNTFNNVLFSKYVRWIYVPSEGHIEISIFIANLSDGDKYNQQYMSPRGNLARVSSWEICQRCAKILLASEHKMQLA